MGDKRKMQQEVWYNNASVLTNLIIGLVFIIILLSQSFAINHNLGVGSILLSIMNHNMIYLLVVIYFILLKTHTGKKYFNFLNLFLIVLYSVSTVTAFLTLFQSFTLRALLSLAVQAVLVIYLIYTFLQETRLWKEFGLSKSLFSDVRNQNYFYCILVLAVLLLTVNLISTTSLDGTILTTLDFIYIVFFTRYIYLYHEYLDRKYHRVGVDFSEKVADFVEDTKVEEKISAVTDKIVDVSSNVVSKVDDFLVENKIDEKMEKVKKKVLDNDDKEDVSKSVSTRSKKTRGSKNNMKTDEANKGSKKKTTSTRKNSTKEEQ